MAISQVSPNPPVPEPVQTKKVDKQDNQGSTTSTVDLKAAQVKADTVTISKQAAQLASQQYSPQEEAKETATQKAIETAQGKK